MGLNTTPITAEDAKSILDSLGGSGSIRELGRELKRRGTPVSTKTLYQWKAAKWVSPQRKIAMPRQGYATVEEAKDAAERAGLSPEVIDQLAKELKGMDDGALLVETMRNMMIMTNVMSLEVQAQRKTLMRTDARGLASVMMACKHLAEGALDMLRDANRTAQIAKGIEDTSDRPALPAPAADLRDPFADMRQLFANEVTKMPVGHATKADINVGYG